MRLNKLENYMKRAEVVSELSPDSETKVGAILVSKDSGAVMASGYNGFIRGANDGTLPTTRPAKYEHIVHAEQNLLANCARHGIRTDGSFVVCTLSPCKHCLRLLWQAGVDTIYFREFYKDFQCNIDNIEIRMSILHVGDFFKIVLSA